MRNYGLVHLDLSFNAFGEEDIRAIADGLVENHSLLGLHMDGNRCDVDQLGFVQVRHHHAHFDARLKDTTKMHTFSRIPHLTDTAPPHRTAMQGAGLETSATQNGFLPPNSSV